MNTKLKKALYESIMKQVAKTVKTTLTEGKTVNNKPYFSKSRCGEDEWWKPAYGNKYALTDRSCAVSDKAYDELRKFPEEDVDVYFDSEDPTDQFNAAGAINYFRQERKNNSIDTEFFAKNLKDLRLKALRFGLPKKVVSKLSDDALHIVVSELEHKK